MKPMPCTVIMPSGEILTSGNGFYQKHPLTGISGIYQVRHIASGRRYIGGCKNLPQRLSNHRSMARLGEHTCKALQLLWNQDGEIAFVFEVLELCSEKQLKIREHFWMMKFSSQLLNTNLGRFGYKRQFKPEIHRKLSRLAKLRHKSGGFGLHWTQRT